MENSELVTAEPTTRKLASIQKILDLQPIPGADAIEVATILGWKVVVGKKDNFKVGDLVVYCEIDSILPDKPEYEFLRAKHFRIKTIRLRGQISQGIVFPLTVLPEHLQCQFRACPDAWKLIGVDVTEHLGITKYEPYVPANLRGLIKGNFPAFLHKTDETRIQAVPDVIERHRYKPFVVTEKIDGTSFTAYYRNGEFGVCSRNLELKDDDTVYWNTARGLNLKERLTALGRNIAIQGELVGQGIQKNKYGLSDVQLKLFNVFDIDAGKYLSTLELASVSLSLKLDVVPVVARFILDETTTVDSLVELSKGFSALNPKTPREGLVFRPVEETYDPDLKGRLSFKVINPEFLLKYDE